VPTTDVDTLRRVARLAGFEFSESDLDALRPSIERALDALDRLQRSPLGAIEPVTQYRVI
jgi:Asp-tRNA(Asn)/Glu-tRNA(Gln) amidotransferase C subunit